MSTASTYGEAGRSEFDHPQYLPLDGAPAEQTLTLLLRKGGLLKPAITSKEAEGIMRYMHLEHFRQGSTISFNAQSDETGRLMLVLAGEANIRILNTKTGAQPSAYSPLGQVQTKWFHVGEGSTLGLVHAFSGLSSRAFAQAATELFVASMTRWAFHQMKQKEPVLALRFLEMTALELALVAMDHEKKLMAMAEVARSMQEHIGDESGETKPAPLFGI